MAEERVENPCKSDEKEGDATRGGSMTPWEQHAAVINLPRFDYNASSSFLQKSRSGFLITCPMERMKSATKEAISFLQEYINALESCDSTVDTEKQKLSPEISENNETNKYANNSNLSIVKLSRRGLILFSFQDNKFHDKVVQILSDLFLSLNSQKSKSIRWCHRIFPIQETCVLSEKELNSIVSKLFKQYLENTNNKLDDEPIKFAVGYNRRGGEENKSEINENKSGLMERENCFRVVGSAICSVAKNCVVDLKSPHVVVLVELLHILGLPNGSPVVGVSVLPFELVSTKSRLSVKSLQADSKPTK